MLILLKSTQGNGTFQNGVFKCEDCDITALDDNVLGDIPQTAIEINFNRNKLATVPTGAFRNYAMCVRLYLFTNFITEVAPHAFRGMDSLEELYLSENRISSLDPATFEGLVALKSLYMDNNMLSELSTDPFRNITTLEVLRFNRNRLSTVTAGTFDELVNLKELWLHGNTIKLIEDQSFKSLKKLQYLYLSYNQLTYVTSEMFAGLESLKFLTFESIRINNIDTLHGFKTSVKNTEINLRNNEISTLSCNHFVSMPKPMLLDISGNRLTCGSHLCWLKQEVESGSINWVVQQSAANGIPAGHVFKPTCADGRNWDDITLDCDPGLEVDLYIIIILTSGGSRIFLEGRPTPIVGMVTYYFAGNCMKMKEFGPPGRWHASLAPPLDPPMLT